MTNVNEVRCRVEADPRGQDKTNLDYVYVRPTRKKVWVRIRVSEDSTARRGERRQATQGQKAVRSME